MKNKFTITLSDVHGSKHYLVNQIIKKFAVYFILFVIFILVAGSYLISFLINEVESFEEKKSKILQEQSVIKEDNEQLLKKIKEKTEEYAQIQDKITDIESMVGITPALESQIDTRLENITFTATQQKLFFTSIPNGNVVPFEGYSGKFGWRTHPILKSKEYHRGLDMRAKLMTPVHAPADGVIEYAGFHKASGFGNLVIMDHNYGFRTTFAHLSNKFPFKMGDFVKKGQIIAYTGNSGLSTGPHLHYEVRFIARPLDPEHFTQWNSTNFESIFKKEKRVSWQSLIRIMEN